MKIQKIRDYRSGHILYHGAFGGLRQALEQAVRDGLDLPYADLSGAALVNAALDGARLPHARFTGANLMGANLSESMMDGADFTGAGLQNVCFHLSSLQRCDFRNAFFGATDMKGCNLRHSQFEGVSALSLNFIETASMEGCSYNNNKMSQPPLVIHGLPRPLALLDKTFVMGSYIRPYADLVVRSNDNEPDDGVTEDPAALHFLSHYISHILPLVRQGRNS